MSNQNVHFIANESSFKNDIPRKYNNRTLKSNPKYAHLVSPNNFVKGIKNLETNEVYSLRDIKDQDALKAHENEVNSWMEAIDRGIVPEELKIKLPLAGEKATSFHSVVHEGNVSKVAMQMESSPLFIKDLSYYNITAGESDSFMKHNEKVSEDMENIEKRAYLKGLKGVAEINAARIFYQNGDFATIDGKMIEFKNGQKPIEKQDVLNGYQKIVNQFANMREKDFELANNLPVSLRNQMVSKMQHLIDKGDIYAVNDYFHLIGDSTLASGGKNLFQSMIAKEYERGAKVPMPGLHTVLAPSMNALPSYDRLLEKATIENPQFASNERLQQYADYIRNEFFDESGKLKDDSNGVIISEHDLASIEREIRRPLKLGEPLIAVRTPVDSLSNTAPVYLVGISKDKGMVQLPHDIAVDIMGADHDKDGISIRFADNKNIRQDEFERMHTFLVDSGLNWGKEKMAEYMDKMNTPAGDNSTVFNKEFGIPYKPNTLHPYEGDGLYLNAAYTLHQQQGNGVSARNNANIIARERGYAKDLDPESVYALGNTGVNMTVDNYVPQGADPADVIARTLGRKIKPEHTKSGTKFLDKESDQEQDRLPYQYEDGPISGLNFQNIASAVLKIQEVDDYGYQERGFTPITSVHKPLKPTHHNDISYAFARMLPLHSTFKNVFDKIPVNEKIVLDQMVDAIAPIPRNVIGLRRNSQLGQYSDLKKVFRDTQASKAGQKVMNTFIHTLYEDGIVGHALETGDKISTNNLNIQTGKDGRIQTQVIFSRNDSSTPVERQLFRTLATKHLKGIEPKDFATKVLEFHQEYNKGNVKPRPITSDILLHPALIAKPHNNQVHYALLKSLSKLSKDPNKLAYMLTKPIEDTYIGGNLLSPMARNSDQFQYNNGLMLLNKLTEAGLIEDVKLSDNASAPLSQLIQETAYSFATRNSKDTPTLIAAGTARGFSRTIVDTARNISNIPRYGTKGVFDAKGRYYKQYEKFLKFAEKEIGEDLTYNVLDQDKQEKLEQAALKYVSKEYDISYEEASNYVQGLSPTKYNKEGFAEAGIIDSVANELQNMYKGNQTQARKMATLVSTMHFINDLNSRMNAKKFTKKKGKKALLADEYSSPFYGDFFDREPVKLSDVFGEKREPARADDSILRIAGVDEINPKQAKPFDFKIKDIQDAALKGVKSGGSISTTNKYFLEPMKKLKEMLNVTDIKNNAYASTNSVDQFSSKLLEAMEEPAIGETLANRIKLKARATDADGLNPDKTKVWVYDDNTLSNYSEYDFVDIDKINLRYTDKNGVEKNIPADTIEAFMHVSYMNKAKAVSLKQIKSGLEYLHDLYVERGNIPKSSQNTFLSNDSSITSYYKSEMDRLENQLKILESDNYIDIISPRVSANEHITEVLEKAMANEDPFGIKNSLTEWDAHFSQAKAKGKAIRDTMNAYNKAFSTKFFSDELYNHLFTLKTQGKEEDLSSQINALLFDYLSENNPTELQKNENKLPIISKDIASTFNDYYNANFDTSILKNGVFAKLGFDTSQDNLVSRALKADENGNITSTGKFVGSLEGAVELKRLIKYQQNVIENAVNSLYSNKNNAINRIKLPSTLYDNKLYVAKNDHISKPITASHLLLAAMPENSLKALDINHANFRNYSDGSSYGLMNAAETIMRNALRKEGEPNMVTNLFAMGELDNVGGKQYQYNEGAILKDDGIEDALGDQIEIISSNDVKGVGATGRYVGSYKDKNGQHHILMNNNGIKIVDEGVEVKVTKGVLPENTSSQLSKWAQMPGIKSLLTPITHKIHEAQKQYLKTHSNEIIKLVQDNDVAGLNKKLIDFDREAPDIKKLKKLENLKNNFLATQAFGTYLMGKGVFTIAGSLAVGTAMLPFTPVLGGAIMAGGLIKGTSNIAGRIGSYMAQRTSGFSGKVEYGFGKTLSRVLNLEMNSTEDMTGERASMVAAQTKVAEDRKEETSGLVRSTNMEGVEEIAKGFEKAVKQAEKEAVKEIPMTKRASHARQFISDAWTAARTAYKVGKKSKDVISSSKSQKVEDFVSMLNPETFKNVEEVYNKLDKKLQKHMESNDMEFKFAGIDGKQITLTKNDKLYKIHKENTMTGLEAMSLAFSGFGFVQKQELATVLHASKGTEITVKELISKHIDKTGATVDSQLQQKIADGILRVSLGAYEKGPNSQTTISRFKNMFDSFSRPARLDEQEYQAVRNEMHDFFKDNMTKAIQKGVEKPDSKEGKFLQNLADAKLIALPSGFLNDANVASKNKLAASLTITLKNLFAAMSATTLASAIGMTNYQLPLISYGISSGVTYLNIFMNTSALVLSSALDLFDDDEKETKTDLKREAKIGQNAINSFAGGFGGMGASFIVDAPANAVYLGLKEAFDDKRYGDIESNRSMNPLFITHGLQSNISKQLKKQE